MKPDNLSTKQLKIGVAEWLISIAPWDLFLTLTFKLDYSSKAAIREFEKFTNMHLTPEHYFISVEGREKLGRVHIHGLLKYPSDLIPDEDELKERWKKQCGRTVIEIPKDQAKVIVYSCKHITKDEDSYRIH